MCELIFNPLCVLSAFHVFQLHGPWLAVTTRGLSLETISNGHALFIPARLCGWLGWAALPALFLSEGLEGQLCHYECTTAYTSLYSANVKVSGWQRQLPEMKATQAICWTNENMYLLIFLLTALLNGHYWTRKISVNVENKIGQSFINHLIWCAELMLQHLMKHFTINTWKCSCRKVELILDWRFGLRPVSV